MKLYQYYIDDNNKLKMVECEMKETPKMYKKVIGGLGVRKENVDCVVLRKTYEFARRCFLSEKNPDKAIDILTKQIEMFIDYKKYYKKKLKHIKAEF